MELVTTPPCSCQMSLDQGFAQLQSRRLLSSSATGNDIYAWAFNPSGLHAPNSYPPLETFYLFKEPYGNHKNSR